MARPGQIIRKTKEEIILEAIPVFDYVKIEGKDYKELLNYDDVYREVGILGKGGFGAVYKVVDVKSGSFVAAKHIGITKMENGAPKVNLGNLDSIKHEVTAYRKLSGLPGNYYIPKYYNSFVLKRNGNYSYVIISEYIEGPEIGTLARNMRIRNGKIGTAGLDEKFISRFTLWLLNAVAFVHANGWAHRDIKPQNVKFDEINNRYMLLDFGISCFMEKGTDVTCDYYDNSGTRIYMPPESFDLTIYSKVGITNKNKNEHLDIFGKADIWMIGATMYSLIENKRDSVWGTDDAKIIKTIIDSNEEFNVQFTFSPITKECKMCIEVIKLCLKKYPTERPTAVEGARMIKGSIPRR